MLTIWHHASCVKTTSQDRSDVEAVVNIRQFQNADLPALVEIWTQHWSAIGPPPLINAARFEQAVLARTYFDPTSLLIAEQDGAALAWCHHSAVTASSPNSMSICAFGLGASCDEAVAEQLLAAAETRIRAAGIERVRFGLVRDDVQGYAGLDPVGHGIGVPKTDIRVTSVLQRCGYSPEKTVVRLTASTTAYRPPVSRDALQLRRSSRVQATPLIHPDPRRAAGMSHLDIETHFLFDRGGSQLAQVNLWLSDPEAEVMNPSLSILDIAEAHRRGNLDAAESYLIGTLIQSLAPRRIQSVETAVDSDKTELLSQLQTLRFQIVEEGILWEKSLRS